MYWPLDNANLKAIAGGIGACDGGGSATAVAWVVTRLGGVDGRRVGDTTTVVTDEDKVGTTGIFPGQYEPECHCGE